ncbi:linker histone H1M [Parambassis ranga]|uniref:Linker histone H1M n=1 Tax=Parambassis ranga TaxID=210632 RepID=A0A6P7ICZ9_9TELE|nr:protein B4 [Parambassis ranga]
MPPKKPAADSTDASAPSPSKAPVEETDEPKSGAAALRKMATHPSTAVMVQEALKELDSRKGVSSQAIQNYIKQKYPSVDLVRLKHLVRNALKKGIENGTLVRPANATVTTGAVGKFRLAPKVKESKPKNENADPNVPKAPKAAKEGAKKPKKTGATKKKKKKEEEDTADEETKSSEASKPPKKSNKEEDDTVTSRAAPAKKPKTKKAEGDAEATSDPTEATETTKSKAAKTTKKAEKTEKASRSKAAKADGEAPASKTTGKRAKKPTD